MGEQNSTTSSEIEDNIEADMNDFSSFNDVNLEDLAEEEIGDISEDEEEESDEEKEANEDIEVSEESSKDDKEEEVEPDKDQEIDEKFIEAIAGEESVKVSANAKFMHKVDGKEEEVTMQELLNDFSGRGKVAKEISAMGQQKQVFKNEQVAFNRDAGQLNSKINSFVDAVNQANAPKAIESLAILADTNPVELREHFLTLMREQSRAYEKLDENQQKVLDNDIKMKYYQDRDKLREEDVIAEREQNDLTNQLVSFQNKHNIDDAQLVALADELEDKSIELSLEALENLQSGNASQDKASNLLGQIDPSLESNEQYIKEVKEFITQNPDLSEDEIIETVKEALNDQKPTEKKVVTKGKSKSKIIQEKMRKSNPKGKTVMKGVDISDLDDVVDFDDILHDF